MKQQTSVCTGECIYQKFKLEYQIIYLEFIQDRSLKIDVVCYNPFNEYDKEAILKYSTNNLKSTDERLKIALLIVESAIKNLKLDKNKLFKLVVRNNKIFYLKDV